MIPVILSGGSGSRLWPMSRASYPKQFLSLNDKLSMFQQTINRLDSSVIGRPIVVCNNEHRFLVAEKLRESDYEALDIILEPIGRNTAPAIALAAHSALKHEADPILLILPSDHVIEDEITFQNIIIKAISLAKDGNIVTFGAVPKKPHTGYGYIKRSDKVVSGGYYIDSFTEKPNISKAKEFLNDSSYYWNSGMFMVKASRYLSDLKKHAPDIYSHSKKAYDTAEHTFGFLIVDEAIFSKCPSQSIDYAIMEKTDKAIVLPLDAAWSDLGSWATLWDISDKDELNNVLQGDVIAYETRNSYIYSDNKLVTTVGLNNIVIVDTKDALLIVDKDRAESVKIVVDKLKQQERSEVVMHREVYRPWGKYDLIDVGARDQVKRITVNPGATLSLQMHHHRAEHWIVVKGTAKVTKGDETFLMAESESTYIPLGTVHSLENPGVSPLEMIEVQTGDYLGEDDIVRFGDKYGRVK